MVFESVTFDGVLEQLAQRRYAVGSVDPVEYHAWKGRLSAQLGMPCVSKSSLLEFMRNPYKYKWDAEHGVKKASRALAVGSLIDCLALTPELAETLYTCEQVDRRTKAGKARAAELEGAGVTPVSPEDMEVARLAAGHARGLIDIACGEGWQSQVGMWVVIDAVGAVELATPLVVTGMLDVCPRSAGAGLVDLKSTGVNLADCAEVNRNVAAFGYGLQAAMYCDLFAAVTGEERDFSFVFVSSEPPCQVRRVRVDEATLCAYRRRYQLALVEFAECAATGRFGSVELDDMVYNPPAWELKGGVR